MACHQLDPDVRLSKRINSLTVKQRRTSVDRRGGYTRDGRREAGSRGGDDEHRANQTRLQLN
jgi:hypothetical protein